MTIPLEVLRCCALYWKKHDEIAREFDRRYPPRWYSIARHVRLLIRPGRPSVDLHFLLELAVREGKLERKQRHTSHLIIVRGTDSRPEYLYRLKGVREGGPDTHKRTFSLLFPCAA